jgi:hypothetical protein
MTCANSQDANYWKLTQHPIGIFSEGFWKQKMDYLHRKLCRKGVVLALKTPALPGTVRQDRCACRCKCWRFSSALFWATSEPCDVQLSDVGIALGRPTVVSRRDASQRLTLSGVISLEFVYFSHVSRIRPSFLPTQTRNAQTTHQPKKVTGTVNNKCPRASMGL